MELTKELLKEIIDTINQDASFGIELYKALIKSVGDEILTKTYLDEALAKQSKEFDEKLAKLSKEFDEKLTRLSKEFDEKLTKLSKEFDEKLIKQAEGFDIKLTKLSMEFDEKLKKQSEDLKKFINSKLGALGSRWGVNAEKTIRNYSEKIIKDFGGKVKKWKRSVRFKTDYGKVKKQSYELDIVLTDSKHIAVEVKSACDEKDIKRFIENCSVYEDTDGKGKKIEKIFITFFIDTEAQKLAERNNIIIIDPLQIK
jgi:hypothetical protein